MHDFLLISLETSVAIGKKTRPNYALVGEYTANMSRDQQLKIGFLPRECID